MAQVMLAAMTKISEGTCIRFVDMDAEDYEGEVTLHHIMFTAGQNRYVWYLRQ